MRPAGLLVVSLCVAEVFGMLGFSSFPALQPLFIHDWSLTGAQAGWINGLFYLGYLMAVPVLLALTDRVAAKRIYLLCTGVTALSCILFAMIADGVWTAALVRMLAGVGLAGTYMPGLKILSDHLDGHARQSRAIAFYTASFSIGTSLSFLYTGEAAVAWGWRTAIGASALGPIAALVLVHLAAPHERGRDGMPDAHLLDFRPVLVSRRAMAYVLAYAAHNFELFALRSWLVSFLVFAGLKQAGAGWLSAGTVTTAVVLAGLPASILGNELAARLGRRRTIAAIMGASAMIALGIGFTAEMPLPIVMGACLLYGVTVTGDSASITAGLVAVAPAGRRGAAMAVHACIGFSGAFLGPLAFGKVLDVSGGLDAPMAWVAAFAVTGGVVALGPMAMAWGARARP